MLSRIEHDKPALNLPEQWKESVTELLQNSYGTQCSEKSKVFEVYGQSYPSEVLVMVCLLDANDKMATPISYFASANLDDKTNPEKIMDTLVDSVGVFFDEYFQTENWDDYTNQWNETKMNNIDFYYKTTRENVGLTLKADEILKFV